MATLTEVLQGINQLIDQKQKLEEQLRGVKDKLTVLEGHALGMMGDETDSQKVEGRTHFKITQTNYSIADPDLFMDWAIRSKNLDFLQRRLASRNVSKYAEDKGELPPGIDSFSQIKLRNRS